jgi:hypothetical protein
VISANFEQAKKTLGIEYELRATELSPDSTLYQMRSEALLLWRANLWPPTLLPNEFH